jgi:hypothetical protein
MAKAVIGLGTRSKIPASYQRVSGISRWRAHLQHGPLQALRFHVALWHMNLAYFDGYPLDSWPQSEVGVILWSLLASAPDWLPRETLTRLCATPVNGVLESTQMSVKPRPAASARQPFAQL